MFSDVITQPKKCSSHVIVFIIMLKNVKKNLMRNNVDFFSLKKISLK
jgi:hypothetical protein